MDSSELECDASGKLSPADSDEQSSLSTGRTFGDSSRSNRFRQQMLLPSMSSAAALHATEQAPPQPSKGNEPGKPSGRKCSESFDDYCRASSLLSSLPAMRNGKRKLRLVWRALATEWQCFDSRLRIVARLIAAGECSLLPTPCKSDAKRGHGRADHPRLTASRGQRLQEELGVRPGPDVIEWLMGFPDGWTDLKP